MPRKTDMRIPIMDMAVSPKSLTILLYCSADMLAKTSELRIIIIANSIRL